MQKLTQFANATHTNQQTVVDRTRCHSPAAFTRVRRRNETQTAHTVCQT